jgi:hypothetical protein
VPGILGLRILLESYLVHTNYTAYGRNLLEVLQYYLLLRLHGVMLVHAF